MPPQQKTLELAPSLSSGALKPCTCRIAAEEIENRRVFFTAPFRFGRALKHVLSSCLGGLPNFVCVSQLLVCFLAMLFLRFASPRSSLYGECQWLLCENVFGSNF